MRATTEVVLVCDQNVFVSISFRFMQGVEFGSGGSTRYLLHSPSSICESLHCFCYVTVRAIY